MTRTGNWVNEAVFASWWLSWEDLSWPDPALTRKWKKRAEHFQSRGVNTVVMFGLHFRFDYAGYFDRVFGLLREISHICHDHGLRVVEHHSATLVHRVRNEKDRHEIRERNFHHVPFYPDNWDRAHYEGEPMADWRQISVRDGEPVFFERYTCACFCPNNPSYQRCYLDYTRRHLEAVPVDAYMSDDLHYLPDFYSCGCRHCRERFRDEEGIDLPSANDGDFWENFDNPDFLKWIAARYRWNSDHYRRLREFLPSDVLLWGCASDTIAARLAGIAYSPQHYAQHWDAVFHEIFHKNQPGRDDVKIASDLAGFASLARHHQKPLIALFYAERPDDVPTWLETIAFHGGRPWLSKQPREENAPAEEELLRDRIEFSDTEPPPDQTRTGIVFSESTRDRLGARAEQDYVEPYRKLCFALCKEGKQVDVLFDGQWENETGPKWKCIHVPGAEFLNDVKRAELDRIREKGVEVRPG